MAIPTVETLKEIREAASALCDNAYDSGIRGAINWGDLECVYVEWFIDSEGDHGYNIYIEEADPFAKGLQDFIFDGLLEYASDGCIRITTRW